MICCPGGSGFQHRLWQGFFEEFDPLQVLLEVDELRSVMAPLVQEMCMTCTITYV